jgi:hypothetical protein
VATVSCITTVTFILLQDTCLSTSISQNNSAQGRAPRS